MGLFDKVKNQAVGAINSATRSTVNQATRSATHAATQAATQAVNSGMKGLQNKRETFTFKALPQNVQQLQALPEANLASPYATAALTVAAMCAYGNDPQAVIDMLNFLRGPSPMTGHDVQFLRDRFSGKVYKPFSYFEGATPQNNYTPTQPYRITVFDNPYSWINEDTSRSSTGPVQYARLLLQSSGADSPRFVMMRLKPSTNQWFLIDYQALCPDVRTPIMNDAWA